MAYDDPRRHSVWVVATLSVIGTLLICVGLFFAYVRYQHMVVDHQNHHGMVAIINYNIQQGKLLMPPELTATPAPAPTPAPSPAPKK